MLAGLLPLVFQFGPEDNVGIFGALEGTAIHSRMVESSRRIRRVVYGEKAAVFAITSGANLSKSDPGSSGYIEETTLRS